MREPFSTLSIRGFASRSRVGGVAFLWPTWCERGGPPVADPDHLGFGGRLLEKGLARELSGEVSLDYNPNGLMCTMRLPLRALEA